MPTTGDPPPASEGPPSSSVRRGLSRATDYLIFNWLRNRNTIEFLGIWEHLYNPAFNPIEFGGIKNLISYAFNL